MAWFMDLRSSVAHGGSVVNLVARAVRAALGASEAPSVPTACRRPASIVLLGWVLVRMLVQPIICFVANPSDAAIATMIARPTRQ